MNSEKKKHIVIDARLYGPKHTGIGRYTKNLILALSNLPSFNDFKFTLIILKSEENNIKNDLGNKFQYVETTIPHYSLAEQFKLPFLLYKLKPDLVHFTHFNKPIFYFGKSVVTIHDLIKHFYKGKETTTKNILTYWPKYWAYLFISFVTIKTNQIIVPSNIWRDYLIKNFNLEASRVVTTHEAVDPKFIQNNLEIRNFKLEIGNYIIYTGNLYPHKNIQVVLKALKKLPEIKLKIICARSFFSQKLKQQINKLGIKKQVEFLGYLDDLQFKNVYNQALALVHPSLMEGFSLTGLEAMALNCPVISSNSSCLPEIYGDSVLYFDPNDSNDLVEKINELKNNIQLRQKLINLGHLQVKKYSWTKTANQTMAVYQNTLN